MKKMSESLACNEILGGLEELGLSKYEASAYYGLLGKGLISANDLAYSSGLPRTKIYSILKKLERKKLVIISKQKPLMFRALSPADSFRNLLLKHEEKISGLRRLIERLKVINDNGLRNKGIDEKHYLLLNQSLTDSKIVELIKSSKQTIEIALNSWGNVLFSAIQDNILKAVIRGVKVDLMIDKNSDIDTSILPIAINLRKNTITSNIFIFDKHLILLMNTDGTKSIVIDSVDIIMPVLIRQFEDLWKSEKSIRISRKEIESMNA
jgi:sugar-specific transcriptional regulator TrmB